MEYTIVPTPEYLRATLVGRETVEETRAFMRSILRANEQHRRTALLIDVRRSRTIFHARQNGLLEGFRRLARSGVYRIGLIGDTEEMRLSHEYLALLARQLGLNVWSFPFEAAAVRWVGNRRGGKERRHMVERRNRLAKLPSAMQRRQGARRLDSQRRNVGLQPAF